MDECKHIEHLQLARDHSIFNPQKWYCTDCNTTESIWACLSCSHIACGRYIAEHALKHFEKSSHPVAFQVNDMYVFCYLCNDYVLNDTAAGDLKSLRSRLSAIKSKNHSRVAQRSRVAHSVDARDDSSLAHDGVQPLPRKESQMRTALWHRRRTLMGKTFQTWFARSAVGRKRPEPIPEKTLAKREVKKRQQQQQEWEPQAKAELESTPPRKSLRLQGLTEAATIEMVPVQAPPPPAAAARDKALSPTAEDRRLKKASDALIKRRPAVTPGVTGLRNLGNTCYMNSVLQVLSHLLLFRQCFLKLDLNQWLAVAASEKSRACKHSAGVPEAGAHPMNEGQEKEKAFGCSRHPSLSSGLSGGSSRSRNMELIQPREPSSPYSSLCHELHTLFQVMWSGEWALVSPFAMLHSVWKLIPAFRGYAQQDAQEFLCELLDKIQRELETTGTRFPALIPTSQRKLIEQVLNVVNNIFHGQLLSQVTCLACDNKSNTVEPFWDLSLEFPERYQCSGKDAASQSCLVTDMLGKFTETEVLEGKIYMCEHCNSKRRKFSSKPVVLTEAQKQLMICHLPQVLRLHLKRFRWSGRNNREKIGVHVVFEETLNMEPFCCRETLKALRPECFIYNLSAVVIHHGKGFGSGHYTAYCYNSEGGFWVHCNDSKLSMCTMDEVRKAQAYILFYTQRVIENGHSKLLPPELLSNSQHPSEESDASSNEVLS
ncbi:ubiquitin carboxyl-terminal hydrolase 44 isoform X1 [Peromyscus maniculatus bairdii]|uniref:Ubiquitin carboxyl-terminal hydrolase n=1 Tax=Peromyscus maniculatus bairdii TaxID=230844 RepID=A0A6J0E432_PERMB|nr:ubiquitin carboxyl-terminal hydrolase 44 isoform X1 [Peromyscus maniculatus bairdii]XP_015862419.1 ubiquitin carboxyl-terminal hydrolase 44 isoform X1 [Peromyscus maniculatus bairdii]XP_042119495.1 ubiquitin carboxyl-terminal hydrolase 44 isoform X1 [Peromyscus maniculatus bairdii]XP_042119496.1 ubiquitin carboxyl-terminal hydrolase 44 isoform X1 [Peromyscus maniculatus bairdii]XP_042119497.1 ubiquitin carboxyl-terminal hydrolase 44 isoform X1 [Peromyscus maniculatus bairdii]XP_042119498.1 